MTVRHLDGGACKEDNSTTLSTSVYMQKQIGLFGNSGDKRHNLSVHRHDHQALRNICKHFIQSEFINIQILSGGASGTLPLCGGK
jgi:hypothetical protein